MTKNLHTADSFDYIVGDFDFTFRRFFTGSDVEQNSDYLSITTELSHPISNLIIVRNPTDHDLVQQLASSRSRVCFPTALVLMRMPSDSIDELLRSLGFTDIEIVHAMSLELAHLNESDASDSYTLKEVGETEHTAWTSTMSIGYELPPAFVERIGPASQAVMNPVSGEVFRYFLAFLDGQPVASSTMIVRNGIVGVYNISTKPEHRGKGLGSFVTSESLVQLKNDGYQFAFLQASAMGCSIYERLGFKSRGTFPFYFHSGIPA